MIISGVPISLLLGIIGLLFERNKTPAILTLLLIGIVIALVLLT